MFRLSGDGGESNSVYVKEPRLGVIVVSNSAKFYELVSLASMIVVLN
jgi:hypothetical protein